MTKASLDLAKYEDPDGVSVSQASKGDSQWVDMALQGEVGKPGWQDYWSQLRARWHPVYLFGWMPAFDSYWKNEVEEQYVEEIPEVVEVEEVIVEERPEVVQDVIVEEVPEFTTYTVLHPVEYSAAQYGSSSTIYKKSRKRKGCVCCPCCPCCSWCICCFILLGLLLLAAAAIPLLIHLLQSGGGKDDDAVAGRATVDMTMYNNGSFSEEVANTSSAQHKALTQQLDTDLKHLFDSKLSEGYFNSSRIRSISYGEDGVKIQYNLYFNIMKLALPSERELRDIFLSLERDKTNKALGILGVLKFYIDTLRLNGGTLTRKGEDDKFVIGDRTIRIGADGKAKLPAKSDEDRETMFSRSVTPLATKEYIRSSSKPGIFHTTTELAPSKPTLLPANTPSYSVVTDSERKLHTTIYKEKTSTVLSVQTQHSETYTIATNPTLAIKTIGSTMDLERESTTHDQSISVSPTTDSIIESIGSTKPYFAVSDDWTNAHYRHTFLMDATTFLFLTFNDRTLKDTMIPKGMVESFNTNETYLDFLKTFLGLHKSNYKPMDDFDTFYTEYFIQNKTIDRDTARVIFHKIILDFYDTITEQHALSFLIYLVSQTEGETNVLTGKSKGSFDTFNLTAPSDKNRHSNSKENTKFPSNTSERAYSQNMLSLSNSRDASETNESDSHSVKKNSRALNPIRKILQNIRVMNKQMQEKEILSVDDVFTTFANKQNLTILYLTGNNFTKDSMLWNQLNGSSIHRKQKDLFLRFDIARLADNSLARIDGNMLWAVFFNLHLKKKRILGTDAEINAKESIHFVNESSKRQRIRSQAANLLHLLDDKSIVKNMSNLFPLKNLTQSQLTVLKSLNALSTILGDNNDLLEFGYILCIVDNITNGKLVQELSQGLFDETIANAIISIKHKFEKQNIAKIVQLIQTWNILQDTIFRISKDHNLLKSNNRTSIWKLLYVLHLMQYRVKRPATGFEITESRKRSEDPELQTLATISGISSISTTAESKIMSLSTERMASTDMSTVTRQSPLDNETLDIEKTRILENMIYLLHLLTNDDGLKLYLENYENEMYTPSKVKSYLEFLVFHLPLTDTDNASYEEAPGNAFNISVGGLLNLIQKKFNLNMFINALTLVNNDIFNTSDTISVDLGNYQSKNSDGEEILRNTLRKFWLVLTMAEKAESDFGRNSDEIWYMGSISTDKLVYILNLIRTWSINGDATFTKNFFDAGNTFDDDFRLLDLLNILRLMKNRRNKNREFGDKEQKYAQAQKQLVENLIIVLYSLENETSSANETYLATNFNNLTANELDLLTLTHLLSMIPNKTILETSNLSSFRDDKLLPLQRSRTLHELAYILVILNNMENGNIIPKLNQIPFEKNISIAFNPIKDPIQRRNMQDILHLIRTWTVFQDMNVGNLAGNPFLSLNNIDDSRSFWDMLYVLHLVQNWRLRGKSGEELFFELTIPPLTYETETISFLSTLTNEDSIPTTALKTTSQVDTTTPLGMPASTIGIRQKDGAKPKRLIDNMMYLLKILANDKNFKSYIKRKTNFTSTNDKSFLDFLVFVLSMNEKDRPLYKQFSQYLKENRHGNEISSPSVFNRSISGFFDITEEKFHYVNFIYVMSFVNNGTSNRGNVFRRQLDNYTYSKKDEELMRQTLKDIALLFNTTSQADSVLNNIADNTLRRIPTDRDFDDRFLYILNLIRTWALPDDNFYYLNESFINTGDRTDNESSLWDLLLILRLMNDEMSKKNDTKRREFDKYDPVKEQLVKNLYLILKSIEKDTAEENKASILAQFNNLTITEWEVLNLIHTLNKIPNKTLSESPDISSFRDKKLSPLQRPRTLQELAYIFIILENMQKRNLIPKLNQIQFGRNITVKIDSIKDPIQRRNLQDILYLVQIYAVYKDRNLSNLTLSPTYLIFDDDDESRSFWDMLYILHLVQNLRTGDKSKETTLVEVSTPLQSFQTKKLTKSSLETATTARKVSFVGQSSSNFIHETTTTKESYIQTTIDENYLPTTTESTHRSDIFATELSINKTEQTTENILLNVQKEVSTESDKLASETTAYDVSSEQTDVNLLFESTSTMSYPDETTAMPFEFTDADHDIKKNETKPNRFINSILYLLEFLANDKSMKSYMKDNGKISGDADEKGFLEFLRIHMSLNESDSTLDNQSSQYLKGNKSRKEFSSASIFNRSIEDIFNKLEEKDIIYVMNLVNNGTFYKNKLFSKGLKKTYENEDGEIARRNLAKIASLQNATWAGSIFSNTSHILSYGRNQTVELFDEDDAVNILNLIRKWIYQNEGFIYANKSFLDTDKHIYDESNLWDLLFTSRLFNSGMYNAKAQKRMEEFGKYYPMKKQLVKNLNFILYSLEDNAVVTDKILARFNNLSLDELEVLNAIHTLNMIPNKEYLETHNMRKIRDNKLSSFQRPRTLHELAYILMILQHMQERNSIQKLKQLPFEQNISIAINSVKDPIQLRNLKDILYLIRTWTIFREMNLSNISRRFIHLSDNDDSRPFWHMLYVLHLVQNMRLGEKTREVSLADYTTSAPASQAEALTSFPAWTKSMLMKSTTATATYTTSPSFTKASRKDSYSNQITSKSLSAAVPTDNRYILASSAVDFVPKTTEATKSTATFKAQVTIKETGKMTENVPISTDSKVSTESDVITDTTAIYASSESTQVNLPVEFISTSLTGTVPDDTTTISFDFTGTDNEKENEIKRGFMNNIIYLLQLLDNDKNLKLYLERTANLTGSADDKGFLEFLRTKLSLNEKDRSLYNQFSLGLKHKVIRNELSSISVFNRSIGDVFNNTKKKIRFGDFIDAMSLMNNSTFNKEWMEKKVFDNGTFSKEDEKLMKHNVDKIAWLFNTSRRAESANIFSTGNKFDEGQFLYILNLIRVWASQFDDFNKFNKLYLAIGERANNESSLWDLLPILHLVNYGMYKDIGPKRIEFHKYGLVTKKLVRNLFQILYSLRNEIKTGNKTGILSKFNNVTSDFTSDELEMLTLIHTLNMVQNRTYLENSNFSSFRDMNMLPLKRPRTLRELAYILMILNMMQKGIIPKLKLTPFEGNIITDFDSVKDPVQRRNLRDILFLIRTWIVFKETNLSSISESPIHSIDGDNYDDDSRQFWDLLYVLHLFQNGQLKEKHKVSSVDLTPLPKTDEANDLTKTTAFETVPPTLTSHTEKTTIEPKYDITSSSYLTTTPGMVSYINQNTSTFSPDIIVTAGGYISPSLTEANNPTTRSPISTDIFEVKVTMIEAEHGTDNVSISIGTKLSADGEKVTSETTYASSSETTVINAPLKSISSTAWAGTYPDKTTMMPSDFTTADSDMRLRNVTKQKRLIDNIMYLLQLLSNDENFKHYMKYSGNITSYDDGKSFLEFLEAQLFLNDSDRLSYHLFSQYLKQMMIKKDLSPGSIFNKNMRGIFNNTEETFHYSDFIYVMSLANNGTLNKKKLLKELSFNNTYSNEDEDLLINNLDKIALLLNMSIGPDLIFAKSSDRSSVKNQSDDNIDEEKFLYILNLIRTWKTEVDGLSGFNNISLGTGDDKPSSLWDLLLISRLMNYRMYNGKSPKYREINKYKPITKQLVKNLMYIVHSLENDITAENKTSISNQSNNLTHDELQLWNLIYSLNMIQNRTFMETSNLSSFNDLTLPPLQRPRTLHELAYILMILNNLQKEKFILKLNRTPFERIITSAIDSVKDPIQRKNMLDILYLIRTWMVFHEIDLDSIIVSDNYSTNDDDSRPFWDLLYVLHLFQNRRLGEKHGVSFVDFTLTPIAHHFDDSTKSASVDTVPTILTSGTAETITEFKESLTSSDGSLITTASETVGTETLPITIHKKIVTNSPETSTDYTSLYLTKAARSVSDMDQNTSKSFPEITSASGSYNLASTHEVDIPRTTEASKNTSIFVKKVEQETDSTSISIGTEMTTGSDTVISETSTYDLFYETTEIDVPWESISTTEMTPETTTYYSASKSVEMSVSSKSISTVAWTGAYPNETTTVFSNFTSADNDLMRNNVTKKKRLFDNIMYLLRFLKNDGIFKRYMKDNGNLTNDGYGKGFLEFLRAQLSLNERDWSIYNRFSKFLKQKRIRNELSSGSTFNRSIGDIFNNTDDKFHYSDFIYVISLVKNGTFYNKKPFNEILDNETYSTEDIELLRSNLDKIALLLNTSTGAESGFGNVSDWSSGSNREDNRFDEDKFLYILNLIRTWTSEFNNFSNFNESLVGIGDRIDDVPSGLWDLFLISRLMNGGMYNDRDINIYDPVTKQLFKNLIRILHSLENDTVAENKTGIPTQPNNQNFDELRLLNLIYTLNMIQNRTILETSNFSNFRDINLSPLQRSRTLHEMAYILLILNNLKMENLIPKIKQISFEGNISTAIDSIKDPVQRKNLHDILYLIRTWGVFKGMNPGNITGSSIQSKIDDDPRPFWDVLYILHLFQNRRLKEKHDEVPFVNFTRIPTAYLANDSTESSSVDTMPTRMTPETAETMTEFKNSVTTFGGGLITTASETLGTDTLPTITYPELITLSHETSSDYTTLYVSENTRKVSKMDQSTSKSIHEITSAEDSYISAFTNEVNIPRTTEATKSTRIFEVGVSIKKAEQETDSTQINNGTEMITESATIASETTSDTFYESTEIPLESISTTAVTSERTTYNSSSESTETTMPWKSISTTTWAGAYPEATTAMLFNFTTSDNILTQNDVIKPKRFVENMAYLLQILKNDENFKSDMKDNGNLTNNGYGEGFLEFLRTHLFLNERDWSIYNRFSNFLKQKRLRNELSSGSTFNRSIGDIFNKSEDRFHYSDFIHVMSLVKNGTFYKKKLFHEILDNTSFSDEDNELIRNILDKIALLFNTSTGAESGFGNVSDWSSGSNRMEDKFDEDKFLYILNLIRTLTLGVDSFSNFNKSILNSSSRRDNMSSGLWDLLFISRLMNYGIYSDKSPKQNEINEYDPLTKQLVKNLIQIFYSLGDEFVAKNKTGIFTQSNNLTFDELQLLKLIHTLNMMQNKTFLESSKFSNFHDINLSPLQRPRTLRELAYMLLILNNLKKGNLIPKIERTSFEGNISAEIDSVKDPVQRKNLHDILYLIRTWIVFKNMNLDNLTRSAIHLADDDEPKLFWDLMYVLHLFKNMRLKENHGKFYTHIPTEYQTVISTKSTPVATMPNTFTSDTAQIIPEYNDDITTSTTYDDGLITTLSENVGDETLPTITHLELVTNTPETSSEYTPLYLTTSKGNYIDQSMSKDLPGETSTADSSEYLLTSLKEAKIPATTEASKSTSTFDSNATNTQSDSTVQKKEKGITMNDILYFFKTHGEPLETYFKNRSKSEAKNFLEFLNILLSLRDYDRLLYEMILQHLNEKSIRYIVTSASDINKSPEEPISDSKMTFPFSDFIYIMNLVKNGTSFNTKFISKRFPANDTRMKEETHNIGNVENILKALNMTILENVSSTNVSSHTFSARNHSNEQLNLEKYLYIIKYIRNRTSPGNPIEKGLDTSLVDVWGLIDDQFDLLDLLYISRQMKHGMVMNKSVHNKELTNRTSTEDQSVKNLYLILQYLEDGILPETKLGEFVGLKNLTNDHLALLNLIYHLNMIQNRTFLETSNFSGFRDKMLVPMQRPRSAYELAYLLMILSNMREGTFPTKSKRILFESEIDDAFTLVDDAVQRRNLFDILYLMRALEILRQKRGTEERLSDNRDGNHNFGELLYMLQLVKDWRFKEMKDETKITVSEPFYNAISTTMGVTADAAFAVNIQNVTMETTPSTYSAPLIDVESTSALNILLTNTTVSAHSKTTHLTTEKPTTSKVIHVTTIRHNETETKERSNSTKQNPSFTTMDPDFHYLWHLSAEDLEKLFPKGDEIKQPDEDWDAHNFTEIDKDNGTSPAPLSRSGHSNQETGKHFEKNNDSFIFENRHLDFTNETSVTDNVTSVFLSLLNVLRQNLANKHMTLNIFSDMNYTNKHGDTGNLSHLHILSDRPMIETLYNLSHGNTRLPDHLSQGDLMYLISIIRLLQMVQKEQLKSNDDLNILIDLPKFLISFNNDTILRDKFAEVLNNGELQVSANGTGAQDQLERMKNVLDFMKSEASFRSKGGNVTKVVNAPYDTPQLLHMLNLIYRGSNPGESKLDLDNSTTWNDLSNDFIFSKNDTRWRNWMRVFVEKITPNITSNITFQQLGQLLGNKRDTLKKSPEISPSLKWLNRWLRAVDLRNKTLINQTLQLLDANFANSSNVTPKWDPMFWLYIMQMVPHEDKSSNNFTVYRNIVQRLIHLLAPLADKAGRLQQSLETVVSNISRSSNLTANQLQLSELFDAWNFFRTGKRTNEIQTNLPHSKTGGQHSQLPFLLIWNQTEPVSRYGIEASINSSDPRKLLKLLKLIETKPISDSKGIEGMLKRFNISTDSNKLSALLATIASLQNTTVFRDITSGGSLHAAGLDNDKEDSRILSTGLHSILWNIMADEQGPVKEKRPSITISDFEQILKVWLILRNSSYTPANQNGSSHHTATWERLNNVFNTTDTHHLKSGEKRQDLRWLINILQNTTPYNQTHFSTGLVRNITWDNNLLTKLIAEYYLHKIINDSYKNPIVRTILRNRLYSSIYRYVQPLQLLIHDLIANGTIEELMIRSTNTSSYPSGVFKEIDDLLHFLNNVKIRRNEKLMTHHDNDSLKHAIRDKIDQRILLGVSDILRMDKNGTVRGKESWVKGGEVSDVSTTWDKVVGVEENTKVTDISKRTENNGKEDKSISERGDPHVGMLTPTSDLDMYQGDANGTEIEPSDENRVWGMVEANKPLTLVWRLKHVTGWEELLVERRLSDGTVEHIGTVQAQDPVARHSDGPLHISDKSRFNASNVEVVVALSMFTCQDEASYNINVTFDSGATMWRQDQIFVYNQANARIHSPPDIFERDGLEGVLCHARLGYPERQMFFRIQYRTADSPVILMVSPSSYNITSSEPCDREATVSLKEVLAPGTDIDGAIVQCGLMQVPRPGPKPPQGRIVSSSPRFLRIIPESVCQGDTTRAPHPFSTCDFIDCQHRMVMVCPEHTCFDADVGYCTRLMA